MTALLEPRSSLAAGVDALLQHDELDALVAEPANEVEQVLLRAPDAAQPGHHGLVTGDRRSPVVEQLTFADFLTAGEFDRHLRRMRPRYRTRWGARLPDLVPAGTSAGLPLVTWLPDDLDEPAVVAAAAARGLAVYGLAPYRIAPGRAGLLFGYGALDESAISEGVRLPAESVAVVRGG